MNLRPSLLPRHGYRLDAGPRRAPVNNQIPDFKRLGDATRKLRKKPHANAFDQFYFSRSHRAHRPAPFAKPLHAQHRRQSRNHPEHRMRHGDSATGQLAGVKRKSNDQNRKRRSDVVGSGPEAWPARSRSRRRTMTCICSSAGPRPAGFAVDATAFPISRCEKAHHRPAA